MLFCESTATPHSQPSPRRSRPQVSVPIGSSFTRQPVPKLLLISDEPGPGSTSIVPKKPTDATALPVLSTAIPATHDPWVLWKLSAHSKLPRASSLHTNPLPSVEAVNFVSPGPALKSTVPENEPPRKTFPAAS